MKTEKTIVRGIRAKQSFWDKCDLMAKKEGIDRNKLIIREINNYFKKCEANKNDK